MSVPPPVRLQKLLARAGLASRREAEEWIRQGRVSVNGRVAELGDRADPSRDAVKVDGRRLRSAPAEKTYLLLNKPKGYVTTTDDPEQRDTVMHLIPGNLRSGVRPVGRLDVQTEGLILLTDDGDLARDVTHPSKGCAKEYEVKVSGVPGPSDLEKLRTGIYLDGRRTRPCGIERTRTTAAHGEGNAWFRVTLEEGRTRQIRRMFEAVGHPVSKLKRVAIGPIRDPALPVGATRRLSAAEVAALKQSLAQRQAGPAEPARPRARARSKPSGTPKPAGRAPGSRAPRPEPRRAPGRKRNAPR
jgi:23S rRNA pseudouridine2605 synthase